MKNTGETKDLVKLRINPNTTIYVDPSKDLPKIRKFYKLLLKRETPIVRKLDDIVIVAAPSE